MDLLPSFYRDNVVLIGDAAHTFLTFTSQGVNSALEDAVALTDALADHGLEASADRCLAGFDRERRGVLGKYIQSGRQLRERFLDPGELAGDLEVPLVN